MATYAVIMAGGIGTRFWPFSRQANPKQFLNVFGEDSLLQATIGRLQGLIPAENCYVVTHKQYVAKTQMQLAAVPEENILGEPISRNTAPCIAYAAAELLKRDPEATMVVLPADHVIRNVRRFHEVLKCAISQAQTSDAIVTIGVTPSHPETGYGYIQFDTEAYEADADGVVACRVKAFAEKPNAETAERFLASGDYLWNSGMFIWRADTIWKAFERYMPTVAAAFQPIYKTQTPSAAQVLLAFEQSPKESIDYGVMEKAESVFVVPGSFGWNDVGDWRAVYELSPKDEQSNATRGEVILEDASRNLVFAGDKMVALVGVHDTIVVHTEDAILVCHKAHTQQVKNVVEYMHKHELKSFI